MKDLTVQDIQKQIVTLPNRPPAMLASAVAKIYEVEAKQVNQAVRRNPERFPADFCFRLTPEEFDNLRSQIVTSSSFHAGDNLRFQTGTSSSSHGGARHLPWMFTRFGANQLSTVLQSEVAVQRSIQIMRAFSAMEEMADSLPSSTLEMIVQRVLATALPRLQAQQAPGYFIETSAVNDYLAWLPHELKKDSFSTKFDLYDTYCLYCSETEIQPVPVSHFFTKLYRCRPSLKNARILVDGKRTPVVLGISILLGQEVQA